MRHLTRAFWNTACAKIRFKVHQIPIVIKNIIFHLIIYIRLHLFLINSYVNITNSCEKSLSSLQKTNKTGPVCFLWKPDLNVNVWKLKRFAYICQYIYIYTQWKRVPTSNTPIIFIILQVPSKMIAKMFLSNYKKNFIDLHGLR